MRNYGSPLFYQEGGCHDRAVLIGHIRLIQAHVLWGCPEPLSAYYDNPFPLYGVLLNVNFYNQKVVPADAGGRAV